MHFVSTMAVLTQHHKAACCHCAPTGSSSSIYLSLASTLMLPGHYISTKHYCLSRSASAKWRSVPEWLRSAVPFPLAGSYLSAAAISKVKKFMKELLLRQTALEFTVSVECASFLSCCSLQKYVIWDTQRGSRSIQCVFHKGVVSSEQSGGFVIGLNKFRGFASNFYNGRLQLLPIIGIFRFSSVKIVFLKSSWL